MLATYSDDIKEPIKIWDIRLIRQDSGASDPVVSIYPAGKTISQIAWSPSKPGVLATTTLDERSISLWDVIHCPAVYQDHSVTDGSSSSTPLLKPFKQRSTHEPIFAFSWQLNSYIDQQQQQQQQQDTVSVNPNRLILASVTGRLEHISIHDTMPLALSPRDGRLGFGCGKLLFGGQVNLDARNDIAVAMSMRSQAGYSMNVLTNLQLFDVERNSTKFEKQNMEPPQLHTRSSFHHRDLRFVWEWVDQVESLRRYAIANMDTLQDTRGGSIYDCIMHRNGIISR
jgi:hypothetical protein